MEISRGDAGELRVTTRRTSHKEAQLSRTHYLATTALMLTMPLLAHAQSPSGEAATVLPKPEAPFAGQIGPTYRESTPDFPRPVAAPARAPNVLLILTDDTGFGHASTFGGAAATPTLDRLAANGLRYNRLHTTALCSPTRAALLTGRNHHTAGTGVIIEMGTAIPAIPASCQGRLPGCPKCCG
jgi:Sulfatase